MVLNNAGAMVAQTWAEMPEKYRGVQIDTFVVMPNHVHGIVLINLQNEGQSRGIAPTDEQGT